MLFTGPPPRRARAAGGPRQPGAADLDRRRPPADPRRLARCRLVGQGDGGHRAYARSLGLPLRAAMTETAAEPRRGRRAARAARAAWTSSATTSPCARSSRAASPSGRGRWTVTDAVMVPELTITADGAHWHPVGGDLRLEPRPGGRTRCRCRSPRPSAWSSSASSPSARPTGRFRRPSSARCSRRERAHWSAGLDSVPVTIQRDFDGAEPIRPERLEQVAGVHEERRAARSLRMATGTLACPACDAPVRLQPGSSSPADPLACPFCAHGGAVRDFLSLASPSRPARVGVYVVRPGRPVEA